MSGWLERWQKRQRELADGADADLMQANRTRFRFALCLFGLGLVLGAVAVKLRLPDTLNTAFRVIAVTSVVVGFVLGKWARQEREFLTRADAEGPPEIFRTPRD